MVLVDMIALSFPGKAAGESAALKTTVDSTNIGRDCFVSRCVILKVKRLVGEKIAAGVKRAIM